MSAWAERASALALAASLGLVAPLAAVAQQSDLVSGSAFRVCADPANLPFSNEAGEGFENRIAELFADELGLPVQYAWYPMAQGFVRRTLIENRCDVIIGYAQGDELVLNTNHYYTSAYVLIVRSDGDLAAVTTLADPLLKGRRIGVVAGTPPASHLARHGLMGSVKGYHLMVDTRFEHPNADMIADLRAGEIDAAVLWGPIGGPLVKAEDGALAMTPLLAEAGSPRLFYRITMGVRPGEDAWKRRLNSMIRELQPQIDAVLTDYGVPLLDDEGAAPKPVAAVPEPDGYRGAPYKAPVPATLAGAEVADDATAYRLWEAGAATFVDVLPHPPRPEDLPEGTLWREPPHDSIPGAVWLPDTGYDALAPETLAYLRAGLEAATDGARDAPLVFFCKAECWMSWNAAKRALENGYTRVIWYPGGVDDWAAAGWPLEPVTPATP